MNRKIYKILGVFIISVLVVCLWETRVSLPVLGSTHQSVSVASTVAASDSFAPVAIHKRFDPASETTLLMSHPKIKYIGRFDQSNASTSVRWGWPGSYFRVRIEGTSFKIALAEPDNHTLVFIDGVKRADIPPKRGKQKVMVAADLDPNWSHDVVVYKRSEYAADPGRIYNLFLDGGATLLSAPEHDRKIVFVGDSFTAGYGNIATSQTSFPDSMTHDEDTSQTYAAYSANRLNADYQIIATSGTGIFRNRTASLSQSPDSMANEYIRVISGLTASYDFSQFEADLVHIFVGLNDYAEGDLPTDDYIGNYLKLINGFRDRNPGIKILCAGFGDRFADSVAAMVAAEKTAGKTDIEYYFLPDMELNPLGDWHPSVQGHRTAAAYATAAIQDVMNW